MKKVLLVSVIAGFAVLGLSTGVASAWHYNLRGSGVCQQDGSYKITWTVDNSSEPSPLDVYESNNSAVPTGKAIVAKKSKKNFTQIADGTKPGNFNLTLKADWKGDRKKQVKTANVVLDKACEQPVVPEEPTEEPGRGAGEVLGEQVAVTPVGAVNAGEGSNEINYFVAITGLVLSISAIAYGIFTLVKSRG